MLDRLERQNRRLWTAVILSCLLAVAALLTPWLARSRNREIQAERFILRDAQGVQRAELALRDNEPLLVLLDTKENPRVTLSSMPPGLALNDEHGVVRTYLYQLAYGPGLDLRDADGRIRAWMGQRKEGPALQLLDPNDKPLFAKP